tara:strand:+ start:504 stop:3188 length:2685 start_codon:yes stop_codon:yes gene_type:complete
MTTKNLSLSFFLIFNLFFINNLSALEAKLSIKMHVRDCESIDNPQECIVANCYWDPIRGCFELETDSNNNDGENDNWEDECNQYSENVCEVFEYCFWDDNSDLCIRIDGSDGNDFEDCSAVDNEQDCISIPECDWSTVATPNGVFEMCIESSGNDSDPCYDIVCDEDPEMICVDGECVYEDEQGDTGGDFEECSDVDNEEDCIRIPECDWSTVATPNGVFEMCVESSSGSDGDWNDDGGWNECSQLSQDECVTIEFCEWDEEVQQCIRFEGEGTGGDFECSDLGYQECVYYDFCEWIGDGNNPSGFGGCVDAAGPSPCSDFSQEDCEWFDECVWTDNGCQDYNTNDCDPNLICGQALTCVGELLYPTTCGPENCDDPIGECDEGDSEIPDCLRDCEGIENINPEQDPNEACDLIISLFGFDPGFNSCISDCDDEVLISINEIVEACYECLSDATLDCSNVFDDDSNNDCGEADLNEEGCCDYQLLTTYYDEFGNYICNGNECDWDSLCPEPGIPSGYLSINYSLFQPGYVSLILSSECGDSFTLIDNEYLNAGEYQYAFSVSDFELYTGAHQVQLIVSNENMFENIVETAYIWICGLLEEVACQGLSYDECFESQDCIPFLLPAIETEIPFVCIDNLYSTEDGCPIFTLEYPNGTGEFACIGCELFIDECDYYECTLNGWQGPFTQDECGEGDDGGCADGGGLLAYLELEDAVGIPGGEVAVPMYLNSPDLTGGVQFKLFSSPGAVPSGINSLDDCFTANYNSLDESYIGILFSLEGCSYAANQDVHIADLIFEISPFVPIGVELALEFDYTIVADSSGNEVLSCGVGSNILLGMLGDVNGDGEVNVLDIVAMVNFALGSDYPSDNEFWASDINNDGYVNVLDIVSIVNIILDN